MVTQCFGSRPCLNRAVSGRVYGRTPGVPLARLTNAYQMAQPQPPSRPIQLKRSRVGQGHKSFSSFLELA